MTDTGKEYAEALFLLAREEQAQAAFSEALSMVVALTREQPAYMELLATPNIPKAERLAAMEQAFAGRVPEYVLYFLRLLLERGHIRSLPACAAEFDALCRAEEGASVAEITSAVPLTEEERSALCRQLEGVCGRTILPCYAVDASLLGGVVVRVDGRVLDGSLKHRLQDMKEVMHR